MEILGSTFDESVFEESRNKASSTFPLSYKPKSCEPEWFCYSDTFEDALEEQKTMKFRADLKYRKLQYQSALNDYTACLSLVPSNNLTVKRDALEGVARCYSHLGRREEALETCDKLRKDATNTCHLTCIFQLELSIHEGCGDLRSGATCLQQLCSLHPFNPWHWLKLARSYQCLLESTTYSECPRESPEQQDSVSQQGERDTARLQAAMCFVRVRLLIAILKIQQFSFVLERSERASEAVEESLQRLNLGDTMLKTISEVMSEDLNPEKMREENQDGESLSGLSIMDFDKRWWNKLHQQLHMEQKTDLCGGDIGNHVNTNQFTVK
ncbi:uncharacterized protein C8orf76 homolog [Brachyhypopomus gauderio]|uniref:uncharacterized protein C8orf76 homolog n=1 Tax=Brachyhypopomus gauderio TaxID=698409 RepID=UPI0040436980